MTALESYVGWHEGWHGLQHDVAFYLCYSGQSIDILVKSTEQLKGLTHQRLLANDCHEHGSPLLYMHSLSVVDAAEGVVTNKQGKEQTDLRPLEQA